MINWILSFVICSGLLLAVYHLILKNESFYRFNRFFLLFALLFSAAVPFTTIRLPEKFGRIKSQVFKRRQTVIPAVRAPQEVSQAQHPVIENVQPVVTVAVPVTYNKPSPINRLSFLWMMYALPVLTLLARFIRNSYIIGRAVKRSSITHSHNLNLVLIDDDITPHSFLHYIFLNRNDYEAGLIEPQIIRHEQAHISQLHSLDVIFAELMQMVFWFNPFLPFYKRAMQLNHEFLADEAVIKTYADVTFYQNLLLAKATLRPGMALTSQFNYLTIKNRLIMMTKTTSAKTGFIKKAAVAPVLCITVLIFANKVIAHTNNEKQKIAPSPDIVSMISRGLNPILSVHDIKHIAPAKKPASLNVMTEYIRLMFKYNLIYITQQVELTAAVARMPKEDRIKAQQLFNQMSAPQQAETLIQFKELLLPAHSRQPVAAEFSHWENQTTKLRVWIDGKEIAQTDLKKYQLSAFAHYNYGMLSLTNPDYGKYEAELHLMTSEFFKKDNELIANDNFQIAVLNMKLVAMHLNTTKPMLAEDYKYYERVPVKQADGKTLDRVRVYCFSGGYSEVDVTPGAKVAFFIDGTFYSEADFKNLPQSIVAKIQVMGHTVGARDIIQKNYPGIDLHGYEGVLWVSISSNMDPPKTTYAWEKQIPELKDALAKK